MKKTIAAIMILAGSLSAAPRVSVGIGFGAPAPAPFIQPACPGPGYTWVEGYYAPNRAWVPGYWAAPRFIDRDGDRYEHERGFHERGFHERTEHFRR